MCLLSGRNSTYHWAEFRDRLSLLAGHGFDTVGFAPLIKDIEFGGFISDKIFDSKWIIEYLNERRRRSSSRNIKGALASRYRQGHLQWRPLIENFFSTLKEFKRI